MKCLEAGSEAAMSARALARDSAQWPSSSARARLDANLRSLDSLLSQELGAPDLKSSVQQLKGPVEAWVRSGKLGELSAPRTLRKLCYLLEDPELINPTLVASGKALELLTFMDASWRDAYLSPLIMLFINVFDDPGIGTPFIEALAELLRRRLSSYTGQRTIPKLARSYLGLIFTKKDPAGLALRIAAQGDDWFGICEAEGATAQVQASVFFGRGLIEFAGITKTTSVLLQEAVFEKITKLGDQDIPKAILAVLINRVNSSTENISVVVKYAFQVFGDPMVTSYWKCAEGSYRKYGDQIEQARRIVAEWVNRKVLDFFFAKASMDDGRKAFWSKYAPRMERIRIVMHTGYAFDFQFGSNSDLKSWIQNRLILVEAETTDIGLIMEYGDWAIVEIGTHGNACYFYERKNPIITGLRGRVASIPSLKNSNLPFLNESGYRGEGRFRHVDGWKQSLNFIMKNKVKMNG